MAFSNGERVVILEVAVERVVAAEGVKLSSSSSVSMSSELLRFLLLRRSWATCCGGSGCCLCKASFRGTRASFLRGVTTLALAARFFEEMMVAEKRKQGVVAEEDTQGHKSQGVCCVCCLSVRFKRGCPAKQEKQDKMKEGRLPLVFCLWSCLVSRLVLSCLVSAVVWVAPQNCHPQKAGAQSTERNQKQAKLESLV